MTSHTHPMRAPTYENHWGVYTLCTSAMVIIAIAMLSFAVYSLCHQLSTIQPIGEGTTEFVSTHFPIS